VDIWFFRVDDFVIIIHVSGCFMNDPLEKLLSLIMTLSLIVALVFIAIILHDLNDLWSAVTDYQQIIKSQNDKIRDLQLLVLSKIGVKI
jgi:hypothetical protein